MMILCPTCGGKGSIPDPKCIGIPMLYVGPNGEGCPYVFCNSCGGTGWVAGQAPSQPAQGWLPPSVPLNPMDNGYNVTA